MYFVCFNKSMLFFEACVYKQVVVVYFEACVRTKDVGRTNARPLALRIPIRSRGVCAFYVVRYSEWPIYNPGQKAR